MSARPYNVLFLCTGNSARSIFAEVQLRVLGRGRFNAFSAGSHPAGKVHPMTLRLLENMRLPTDGLSSKSWDEFAGPKAAEMDFVFTVCDQAAGEQCPFWPGQPMTAHWGVPDPAAVEGDDEHRMRAFRDAAVTLKKRIELFISLPIEKLERLGLQAKVTDIGRTQ